MTHDPIRLAAISVLLVTLVLGLGLMIERVVRRERYAPRREVVDFFLGAVMAVSSAWMIRRGHPLDHS